MINAQPVTSQSSTQKYTLGTRWADTEGNEYVYCQDSGAGVSIYRAVAILSDFTVTALTKTLAENGHMVGFPQVAMTASYYAWVQIRGNGTIHTLSACASEALLFTTATAGTLDDTSTSQTGIANVYIKSASAATAAASANVAAYMEYPKAFAAESTFDVAESMADSAALIATSAASSAMSAQSQGTSSALLAVSAASSAMSAQSQGTSCGRWDSAWSTFVSVVSAGSISASGASVAKASYPVEGNSISVLISCTTSTG